MAETRFSVDYAKRASNCKRCKQPLPKTTLRCCDLCPPTSSPNMSHFDRVAKITPNPFSSEEGGDMKAYHHAQCIFDSFLKVAM